MTGRRAKKFDLNVEEVLDDWEVHHAIREIIANAIDEQTLTETPDIKISGSGGRFEIRDYGRGLRYAHLTQNEDAEKLARSDNVIGKFGVGLKDALATLNRHRIGVSIKSRHGDITVAKSPKHGFSDVNTLHAVVAPPSDPELAGTRVEIDGCTADDMERAKALFLRFSGEHVSDHTQYGDILEKQSGRPARIYVNGVVVAEEDNFMFSYNIVSLTKSMRKALNRERSNVGRSAYTDRVKSILLASESEDIARRLAGALGAYGGGTQPDEMKWVDVSAHACKIHNESSKSVFVTPEQLEHSTEVVGLAKRDGLAVTVVPESVRAKISGAVDMSGNEVRDLEAYGREYSKSFEFKFIKGVDLTVSEKRIYGMTSKILAMAGMDELDSILIRISETMRPEVSGDYTGGVWEPQERMIVIKRDRLEDAESYAGTLLHEAAHAASGAGDVSREFEAALTEMLGRVAAGAAKQ